VYEGEWMDDEPRCGVYRAPNREEEAKFREPSIIRESFSLPELGLKNAQSVVDTAKSETRVMNATLKGVASERLVPAESSLPPEHSMQHAKEIFASICDHSGAAFLISLGPVLMELLGTELTRDDVVELAQQLEIGPDTPLTFPDVVDIATFIRGNSGDDDADDIHK
jgi:hypothetical protein